MQSVISSVIILTGAGNACWAMRGGRFSWQCYQIIVAAIYFYELLHQLGLVSQNNAPLVFTARRCASAVCECWGQMSVCPSLCHRPELSKWLNKSGWFLAQRHVVGLSYIVLQGNSAGRVQNRDTSLWKSLDYEKFHDGTSTVASVVVARLSH